VKNPVVRKFVTIFLLLMYINRGFFIFGATEVENANGEINSVLEYIMALVTGESNDIDEDGDMQTDCQGSGIAHFDFSQQLAQNIELTNLFSKNIEKSGFSNEENLPANNYYRQIDQPPEV
jgi:hypothetical protein